MSLLDEALSAFGMSYVAPVPLAPAMPYAPEKALIVAIIEQAIMDAAPMTTSRRRWQRTARKDHDDAIAWLCDLSRDDAHSIRACCAAIGIDVLALVKWAQKVRDGMPVRQMCGTGAHEKIGVGPCPKCRTVNDTRTRMRWSRRLVAA